MRRPYCVHLMFSCFLSLVAFHFACGAPPIITRGPEDQTAVVNQNVEYFCETKINGTANITWFKNGVLPTTRRWRPNGYYLLFKKLEIGDSSSISCKAVNDDGMDEKTGRLTIVTDKPVTPDGFNVRALNSTSIAFIWRQLGEQSNGRVAEVHILEYRLVGSSEWLKSGDLRIPRSGEFYNLRPFGLYEFRLLAKNAAGESDPTEATQFRMPEDVPSGPPQDVSVTAVNSTQIEVSWSPPIEEDRNGNTTDFTVKFIDGQPGRTVSNLNRLILDSSDGIKAHSLYNVSVSAHTSVGSGPFSAVKPITTPQDASDQPPSNVIASPLGKGIKVTWEKPSGQLNGVLHGYKVYFESSGGDIKEKEVLGGGTLTVEITEDIKPYTQYSVRVQAFTNSGFEEQFGSPMSESVDVLTNPSLPGPPSNFKATASSSTSLSLTWKEPAETNGPLSHYRVQYTDSTNTVVERFFDKGKTSAELTGLKKNGEYRITLAANTSAGFGEEVEVTAKTDEDVPSASPVSLGVLSSTATSLTVSWGQVPSDDQNGIISGYRLSYAKQGSKGEKSVDVTGSMKFTVKDLEAFQKYTIRILAKTSKGDGPLSAPVTGETKAAVPSAAPSNVRVVRKTSTTLKVSWKPLDASQWNGPREHYVVEYNRSSQGEEETETTELTLKNLEPFTVYSITVYAGNQVGRNEPGSSLNAMTSESVPGEPEMKITMHHPHRNVTVMWDPPKKPNGIITGYSLRYRLNDSESYETKNFSSSVRSHFIGMLVGNSSYWIELRAKTSVGFGPAASQTVMTPEGAPEEGPKNIQFEDITKDSVTVTWDEIEKEKLHGFIRHYRIRYGPVGKDEHQTKELGSLRRTELTDLQPFTKYEVRIAAETNERGPFSESAYFNTSESAPGEVDLRVVEVTDSGILLNWNEPIFPNGIITKYRIQYKRKGDPSHEEVEAGKTKFDYHITNLSPYTSYEFRVFACTQAGCMAEATWFEATTEESRPGKPNILKVEPGDRNIRVTWEKPSEPKGVITHFEVTYEAINKDKVTEDYNTSGSAQEKGTEYTFANLQPQMEYTFKVHAFTKIGRGDSSDPINENVPPAAPKSTPSPKRIGPSSLEFSLKGPDQIFGEISFFQISVTGKQSSGKQKRADSLYIAAQFDGNKMPPTFVLGDNKTYSSYWNKPPSPGTYQLVLSSHVIRKGFKEDVSHSNPSEPFTIEKETSSSNLILIIAVVVAVLVIALIIILVIVCWRRRRRKESSVVQTKQAVIEDVERSPMDCLDSIEALRQQQKSATEKYPAVKISEFESHVKRLQGNGNSKFTQEYEAIKLDMEFTSSQSMLQCNEDKNRYSNIVAYDHTRVRLNAVKGEQGSDYINANFIDGHGKKNAYIATQGPLKETVKDFWRLLWEQQSSTIVMLTNLEERGRCKCYRYWPDTGSQTYEAIQVTLKEVITLADYTVRTFDIAKIDRPDDCREVKQFHFTCWPDHGVPQYATAMLSFIRKVKFANQPNSGPMVVHCSAGVGRTGAFIVIDAMLDRMLDSESIDIFGHVMVLRSQRNFMVQTEDQYFFIHDAVLEAIQCGYTEINAKDLPHAMQKLSEVIADDGSTAIELEFKRLAMDKLDSSRFQSANRSINKNKNRFVNILPFEASRVPLMFVRGVEGSDYINGSFIDGYKQKHAFIATQGSLKETEQDFWRMIWEQESKIVVMLTKLTERAQEKCHKYWPEVKPARYGPFVIEPLSEQRKSDCILRQFKLTNTPDGQTRTICQYQYVGWPENRSPVSGRALIDLIGEVQKLQEKTRDHGPVTVHCSAGVGRTGCFIALTIVLERMRCEGVLDIFQTVKMLRIQRPAMVQTLDQYQFVYDTALEYLDSFDHYADYAPLDVQEDEEEQLQAKA